MQQHANDGIVVVGVAVQPPPDDGLLLSALLVAGSRLHGMSAVDDVAMGPQSVGVLVLNEEAFPALDIPRLQVAIEGALCERGHRVLEIDLRVIASSGLQKGRQEMRTVSAPLPDWTVSSERHAFHGAVRDVLDRRRLQTFFEPIFNLSTGSLTGYEALVRGPANHPLETVAEFLAAARQAGIDREATASVTWVARVHARQRLPMHPSLLFLSVGADHFVRAASQLYDWESENLWPLAQTVIELNGVQPEHDIAGVMDEGRRHGVRFAVRVGGAAEATRETLARLRPEFVKIAATSVRDFDPESVALTRIASLCNACRAAGAEPIGDGVETMTDLALLNRLGIHAGQGLLLGLPEETPSTGVATAWLNASIRGTPAARVPLAGTQPV